MPTRDSAASKLTRPNKWPSCTSCNHHVHADVSQGRVAACYAGAPMAEWGDGHPDGIDNCPLIANPGQEDADGQAIEADHALRGRRRLSRAIATARASRSASRCASWRPALVIR